MIGAKRTRRSLARIAVPLILVAGSCASNQPTTAPSTAIQTAEPTLPGLPGLPSIKPSTSLLTTSTPSSLAMTDESGLPVADLFIEATAGGTVTDEAFELLEIGADSATNARQVMTAATPVGTMSYYEWTDSAGERCVGFIEPNLSSWGCGDTLPGDPPDRPSWVRLGAAWGDERYAVTPDPLPSTVIAVDVVTGNGYRVRTVPVQGYAILADTIANGLPTMVTIHFEDGTQLSQATNFVLSGPS